MMFILSAVFERMVRFLTEVDVVLEEHNSSLPNNKWLRIKYVLIVFEFFKGIAKKKVVAKNGEKTKWGRVPPRPFLNPPLR